MLNITWQDQYNIIVPELFHANYTVSYLFIFELIFFIVPVFEPWHKFLHCKLLWFLWYNIDLVFKLFEAIDELSSLLRLFDYLANSINCSSPEVIVDPVQYINLFIIFIVIFIISVSSSLLNLVAELLEKFTLINFVWTLIVVDLLSSLLALTHASEDTKAASNHEPALETHEDHSYLSQLLKTCIPRIFVAILLFDIAIPPVKNKAVNSDKH